MKLFTAQWCNPCKDLKSWLDEKGYELDIIDIDEDVALAASAGVKSVPELHYEGAVYSGRENIKPFLEAYHG